MIRPVQCTARDGRVDLVPGAGNSGKRGSDSREGRPATTPATTPATASLTLDRADSGARCIEGSTVSGLVGQWVTLPTSSDCTSTTVPDARLLGWATTPGFPVEIAQRQIDNGWGAYELIDDAGALRAVFIPVGGATFLSSSNTLHPIWAA